MDDNEDGQQALNNVKITLLGGTGVGKTCIIKRFTLNSFDLETPSTSGGSYSIKTLDINGKEIQCDLWDTAGQEKFRSLGRHFYKDSYIVCLVYDITNYNSFNDLKTKWYEDLKLYGEKYSVLGVVGNKSDRYEEEEVKEEEARSYAEEIGATFMLVSAKTGDNIDLLFDTLVRKYLGPEFAVKLQEMQNGHVKGSALSKDKSSPKSNKGGCC